MAKIIGNSGQVITDESGNAITDGSPPDAVYDARSSVFFAVEIDAYAPGPTPDTLGNGVTDVLRVSDFGYRTKASDPQGVISYPARLDTAFEIDRRITLDNITSVTTTFGALRLINSGSYFDEFVLSHNVDSRQVRILVGQKEYDASRGLYLDPPYSDLRSFFTGSAGAWLLNEDELEITLKDTSYWTQRPVQSKTYGGNGKLDGNDSLKGKSVPMVRGGSSDYPVLNVPLTAVDPEYLIYQWTDGPGTVEVLYEGGSAVFEYEGDVADLYVDHTSPGCYRTCNALGVLQLGSPPVRQITADVTGAFPVAGQITTACAIALRLMTETLAMPLALVDESSFLQLDSYLPYKAGFSLSTEVVQGLDLIKSLLSSVGARLISSRSGQLRAFLLQALFADAAPAKYLSTLNVVSLTPAALPSSLDPPPYRWTVSYGHNYLVQTGDFNASVRDDRKQFLAEADRYSTWTDTDVSASWLRPNDPPAVNTLLLKAEQARYVAEDLGTLWRNRPGYYTVVVPLDFAVNLDIGSIVHLTWPLGELKTGKLGQIVGEQIRSYDSTITFEIMCISKAPFGLLDLVGVEGENDDGYQTGIIGVLP